MKFKTADVLGAAFGKLLGDIGGIYRVLNFMLDEHLFTHQLPRAGRFCAPFILQQHPELEAWKEHDEKIDTSNYREYQKLAAGMFGETLELQKVPAGVWTSKSPLEEAEEMIPTERIIAVNVKTS